MFPCAVCKKAVIAHAPSGLESAPALDWLEITSENFMVAGGKPRHYLDAIRARYPLEMHGVSLGIGGTDPLHKTYLRALKQLMLHIEPAWVSDHLCLTGVNGLNSHDLLPLPYSDEAIAHLSDRIGQVQDYLGREILLENLSTYVEYSDSAKAEWEFLTQVSRRSGCRLLLDVNNIIVSARNHGFDPEVYLAGLPAERIWKINLAGHSDYQHYVIDTHDQDVPDAVWALYESAIRRFGAISTMIERDADIPPLEVLVSDLGHARQCHALALSGAAQ